MSAKNAQVSAAEQNARARAIVLATGKEMTTQIFQQSQPSALAGTIVNVTPRNVGLIKKFVIVISGNVAQSAAETQTRSTFGPANILSNVQFVDLNNITRVNTSGWHLHLLATARRRAAFGAAFTNDSPIAVGSAFSTIKMPSSVTTIQPFRMIYEVPVSYGDQDLRGIVPASVVNATMNLQLTFNSALGVASTGNDTLSVFKSSTTALPTFSGVTVTVYQVYLDQTPPGIIPGIDVATAYYLNNTTIGSLVANQDNSIQFANYREFLSTSLIYDNNGTLAAGTDITSFTLQGANTINFFKFDPFYSSLLTRQMIGNDFPLGSYYFDHRADPINTLMFGNMQLLVNPSSVASASGSNIYVGWESMGIVNMVTGAGSLANS